jgi:mercuric ion transport protein
MGNILEKLGSSGAIVAAAACPMCFPKLALLGSVLGMGALTPFEGIMFFAAQGLVLLVLVGTIVAYRKSGARLPLGLSSGFVLLFFISLYVIPSEWLSYLALLGLVASNLWLIWRNRQRAKCVPAQASSQ